MRIISWLDTLGNALLLQLLFLAFSLPVITAAPAAIALQRQFRDLCQGEKTGMRSYALEFVSAWRAAWPIGILFPLAAVGFAVGIPFWYSSGSWLGTTAMVVLICLAGLALAFWLAFLWAADSDRATSRSAWRAWAAAAAAALVQRSGRVLWGLVLLVTWLALAAFFLPALLVGAGLAPAAIVYWTLSGRPTDAVADGQARRS
ncbi:hypothetical protein [Leifsonia sp. NPDC058230]|uniref:hypothetical protein n=1 Tax=Leifsonia sp. NPDC058230 TaxID=3346391 RepID=UPI0036DDF698